MYQMQKKRYYRRKSIRIKKKEDLVSRVQDREKEAMVKLRSSSMPYRGKSIIEWHMDRDSKKHNKGGGQPKRHQENV